MPRIDSTDPKLVCYPELTKEKYPTSIGGPWVVQVNQCQPISLATVIGSVRKPISSLDSLGCIWPNSGQWKEDVRGFLGKELHCFYERTSGCQSLFLCLKIDKEAWIHVFVSSHLAPWKRISLRMKLTPKAKQRSATKLIPWYYHWATESN